MGDYDAEWELLEKKLDAPGDGGDAAGGAERRRGERGGGRERDERDGGRRDRDRSRDRGRRRDRSRYALNACSFNSPRLLPRGDARAS